MEDIANNAQATILLGKYIGASIATIGMLGAAIGVGMIFSSALQGIARNPSKEGSIKGFALLGMALAEFMGLLAFVVVILIAYVIK